MQAACSPGCRDVGRGLFGRDAGFAAAADGRARLVQHGHGLAGTIQTGIGAVPVTHVRIRDRGATEPADRIRFTSTLLPKWARRTRSLDALLPILYLLRRVSTGDFHEALAELLGWNAPNLLLAAISQLTAVCADEYARRQGAARFGVGNTRVARCDTRAQSSR